MVCIILHIHNGLANHLVKMSKDFIFCEECQMIIPPIWKEKKNKTVHIFLLTKQDQKIV